MIKINEVPKLPEQPIAGDVIKMQWPGCIAYFLVGRSGYATCISYENLNHDQAWHVGDHTTLGETWNHVSIISKCIYSHCVLHLS